MIQPIFHLISDENFRAFDSKALVAAGKAHVERGGRKWRRAHQQGGVHRPASGSLHAGLPGPIRLPLFRRTCRADSRRMMMPRMIGPLRAINRTPLAVCPEMPPQMLNLSRIGICKCYKCLCIITLFMANRPACMSSLVSWWTFCQLHATAKSNILVCAQRHFEM